jgi:RTX calcium-binding nonapeptide repeat (4 copies)/FG-GAP repeat
VLLGAALGGEPAGASVSLQRTDVALPGAPDSVALGDLDGRNGNDIVVAFPALGSVGVMLNNGDGTFAALQQYSAGPHCAGLAVDITLGDVTQPAATGDTLLPDGKLDAYVACAPYVVRLTGDGTGALGPPVEFNLGLQQYLGSDSLDLLALVRRPDGNPAPLLLIQHGVGSFGRELCLSYELVAALLVCDHIPVQGPLVVGDLNGSPAGVPPDEVVTAETPDKLGIFGFVSNPPLTWADGTRDVPGGVESAAVGDLDRDGLLDVVVGKPVNSLSERVDSIHYLTWRPGNPTLLGQARALPSIPGVDGVAVADVDGNGCNDIVAAGTSGRGMIHLGDCAGNFDGGQDLPQIGYQNPATATRASLAVGELIGDGRPELVIADQLNHAAMIFCHPDSCTGIPATAPTDHVPPVVTGSSPPPSVAPRTCLNPGTVPYGIGTTGDDVLVGGAGRDVLSGRGGHDCVFGLAGDDRLSGGTGADLLAGSGGADRLNGDAGDDKIDGGNGNDSITPGAGKDRVSANGGNDTISARDGTRDTIDCGAGRDTATIDRTDTVKHCEHVKRPARHG